MIGKNMGNKIYDYYPNKVMKLKIFKDDNYSFIHKVSLSYLTFYVILNKIIYHLPYLNLKIKVGG